MSAAQDDFDVLADLTDIKNDQRADPLVGVVAFPRDLFTTRQDRVCLAEIDDDRPPFEALNGSRDQVTALTIFKFIEKAISLGLADLLDDHLLGCLGGRSAHGSILTPSLVASMRAGES